MPITKSAKKAHARSVKLHDRNLDFKVKMKMAIKKFAKNVTKGVAVAEEELHTLYKYIDKACKVGVIKKQTAAKRKSSVARAFNKINKK